MQSAQPVFLNLEYLFFLVTRFFGHIFSLEFLETLRTFATILVILFIALVMYLLVRLYELKQEDKRKALLAAAQATMTGSGAASPVSIGIVLPTAAPSLQSNPVWEGIRAKLLSDNQSDWRLGIIEADIYMDRVLDDKGYHGETTSDKLKQLTPAQLASVQIAWEAHKVRNRIAHDGAAFELSQPEVRRILSYFEIVFRDLEVIA